MAKLIKKLSIALSVVALFFAYSAVAFAATSVDSINAADVKERIVQGKVTINIISEGKILVSKELQGLTVAVGNLETTTNEHGNYVLSKVPFGNANIIVTYGKKELAREKLGNFDGTERKDIVINIPYSELKNNMHPESDGVTGQAYIPCLDNNGWFNYGPSTPEHIGFPGSDCDISLGNYAECWPEVFGEGTRYCDGTKNCSRLIGHSMYWHSHAI
ncbi:MULTISPECIES: hypothetical protein [Carboxydocella]|nr:MULTISPECIES: hypothetical protein [Carboxydocella]